MTPQRELVPLPPVSYVEKCVEVDYLLSIEGGSHKE
jgi:hypothetical protein